MCVVSMQLHYFHNICDIPHRLMVRTTTAIRGQTVPGNNSAAVGNDANLRVKKIGLDAIIIIYGDNTKRTTVMHTHIQMSFYSASGGKAKKIY
jgi:hypothetical protein